MQHEARDSLNSGVESVRAPVESRGSEEEMDDGAETEGISALDLYRWGIGVDCSSFQTPGMATPSIHHARCCLKGIWRRLRR